jgi:hypothetical protein
VKLGDLPARSFQGSNRQVKQQQQHPQNKKKQCKNQEETYKRKKEESQTGVIIRTVLEN